MTLFSILVGFYFVMQIVAAIYFDFEGMVDEVIHRQDSKVARVMGTIFYIPAFLFRFLYESVKSAK